MGASAHNEQALRASLRLAPRCDPTRLSLSPEEGFLLSRIDGRTSWASLREIAGLSPEAVDHCLERWIADGVLVLDGEEDETSPPSLDRARPPHRDPEPEGEPAQEPAASAPDPRSRLDPTLDLPIEIQERILAFEDRLGLPYHEVLGVSADADAKVVKRAYFKLSREFHPDRYFRRNVGSFGGSLERIFRKLLEAHEMLSDPMARAEMQRSLESGGSEAARAAAARPSTAELQRRLRSFGAHARALLARRQKAKHYFETGMAAFRAERWLEAAASVRLAIAFDPGNEAYREAFGEVQQRAHEERAKQLVREGDGALEVGDSERALHAFEEALHFRPHDAELYHRTAWLGWRSGTCLRRAKELALGACELDPDVAAYRRTLGQIYKAAGLGANARRELRRAVELDPGDAEARSELGSLGRG
jgi:curved DNA-binding protein CbpA